MASQITVISGQNMISAAITVNFDGAKLFFCGPIFRSATLLAENLMKIALSLF